MKRHEYHFVGSLRNEDSQESSSLTMRRARSLCQAYGTSSIPSGITHLWQLERDWSPVLLSAACPPPSSKEPSFPQAGGSEQGLKDIRKDKDSSSLLFPGCLSAHECWEGREHVGQVHGDAQWGGSSKMVRCYQESSSSSHISHPSLGFQPTLFLSHPHSHPHVQPQPLPRPEKML